MLPARDIDDLEELGHKHRERRSIDRLPAWIVTYTDNLGLIRVVDIQGEIVPRKCPVQCFGSEAVERHAGGGNLALQLLEGLVLDGIGKGVALHLQLVELLHHSEDFPVILSHQLNQMREGAVFAVLVDFQEPDKKVPYGSPEA